MYEAVAGVFSFLVLLSLGLRLKIILVLNIMQLSLPSQVGGDFEGGTDIYDFYCTFTCSTDLTKETYCPCRRDLDNCPVQIP